MTIRITNFKKYTTMRTNMLLIAIAMGTILTACSKDDDNSADNSGISVAAVQNSLQAGTWRVTYFWDKDHDETSNFSGYHFTFFTAGTIMAMNTTEHVQGTWSAGTDNSKVKLNLAFTSSSNFQDLTEDWQVIERTATRIKLQHTSGGYGDTDFLTFEKD